MFSILNKLHIPNPLHEQCLDGMTCALNSDPRILNSAVGATVQPAALPEISAGPADPAAPERYRWNRCIQVRQLDAAVNWDISCSCVSNSSNAAASPATQICKSFQTICFSCDQAALQMVLSVCLSVCPSVPPFSLCSHHRIIIKFSGVITNDQSKFHAKGQGQRSKVKVTEVKTQLNRFRTVTPV